MQPGIRIALAAALILSASSAASLRSAEATFTVATFNVENYIEAATDSRAAKTSVSKARIRESIRSMRPDVLALQEMGGTNALLELRSSLKAEGLDFPHWEHLSGWDTNIHVALLSRFPITARRPHTNASYLLQGRRFYVSRGFAEVDVQVSLSYRFTLIAAHLKSRRESALGSQEDMRLEEAKIFRQIIDARLTANSNINLIVLGDFNDAQDSTSTKVILGPRGRRALIDTRPAERNGDNLPNPVPSFAPRHVTWTYFYGKEDTYSRIDYILLSPGMAREWRKDGSYIVTVPNWGLASDHRPIIATFEAKDQ